MKLSIIIPTFNEKKQISNCIASFGNCSNVEIIVSDSPNSLDNIKNTVEQLGVTYFKSKKGGRNFQMNEAATIAKGDVLYFVHADTIVTKSFYADIQKAIVEGFEMGCYRYKFDQYKNPLLYINSFFTRFPMLWCRGGDQTLFVKKTIFDELGGFCENHHIMEDYDFLKRSHGKYRFKIIPKNVVVSARKYETNGYFKVQWANFTVMRKWLNESASPDELKKVYSEMLNRADG